MDPWLIQLIALKLAFVAFLLWLFTRYRSEQARRKSEERIRLLDRFETKDELEAFLASSVGKDYVDRAGQRPADPRKMILGSIAAGIVTLALGCGMFLVVTSPDGDRGLVLPATVLSAAGIGILIAAVISALLARSWGLGRENDRS